MGAGGRHETICERKRAKPVMLGSSKGAEARRLAVRMVAAFVRQKIPEALGAICLRGARENLTEGIGKRVHLARPMILRLSSTQTVSTSSSVIFIVGVKLGHLGFASGQYLQCLFNTQINRINVEPAVIKPKAPSEYFRHRFGRCAQLM